MSLFDGVTGLFENVFDCAVTITRPGGSVRDVRGIFREEPAEQGGLDGSPILLTQPVLVLRFDAAGDIRRDDLVEVSDRSGVTFTVLSVQPSRSPATDRHIVVVLSENLG